jgi:hypothetical protein
MSSSAVARERPLSGPFDIVLVPEPEPKFNLKKWRTERLGLMKARPEYQGLDRILREIVDYCVRRHESREEGITVSQQTLAAKFGVHRDTMGTYLREIVRARVFTREFRSRQGYGERGRTSNRYRLNEALFSVEATDDRIDHPDRHPV